MPPSAADFSKKAWKVEENEFYLGRMRNPAVAVSRLSQVREVGLTEEWETFAERFPQALDLGHRYGTKKAAFDEEVLRRWRRELEELLEVKVQEAC